MNIIKDFLVGLLAFTIIMVILIVVINFWSIVRVVLSFVILVVALWALGGWLRESLRETPDYLDKD